MSVVSVQYDVPKTRELASRLFFAHIYKSVMSVLFHNRTG